MHAQHFRPCQPRLAEAGSRRCNMQAPSELKNRICHRSRCSAKKRQATETAERPPKNPPTVHEELLGSLAGRRPDDDGRVREGRTMSGERGKGGRFYLNVTGFPFPLGPTFARQTVRYEVEPDTMWCFEQEQTLAGINVATVVRMTVVKLKKTGGLLIYAPIAPTRECCDLLAELGAPVDHIILTTHAYEHKIFVSPFQRRYPKAQVHVVPNLWSFPLNLPLPLLGIFNAKVLKDDDPDAPWAGEMSCKVLTTPIGAAPYCEAAFYHKRARVLMVTDAVVFVSEDPPEVVNRDKLQRAGQDNLLCKLVYPTDRKQHPANLMEQEQLGWKRMALLISYFNPKHLRDPSSWPGIGNKLIVMPVVQFLVFAKVPGPTRRWIDAITTEWNFNRVISAHFNAPVQAGPQDVRKAFSFVYEMEQLGQTKHEQRRASAHQGGHAPFGWPDAVKRTNPDNGVAQFPDEDLRALKLLDNLFKLLGVVFREPRN